MYLRSSGHQAPLDDDDHVGTACKEPIDWPPETKMTSTDLVNTNGKRRLSRGAGLISAFPAA